MLGDDTGRSTRPRRAGCDTTYKRAAAYLSGVGQVEDWGSAALRIFERFIADGCYRGIDRDASAAGVPSCRPRRLYLDNRRHLPAACARA